MKRSVYAEFALVALEMDQCLATIIRDGRKAQLNKALGSRKNLLETGSQGSFVLADAVEERSTLHCTDKVDVRGFSQLGHQLPIPVSFP